MMMMMMRVTMTTITMTTITMTIRVITTYYPDHDLFTYCYCMRVIVTSPYLSTCSS